MAEGCGSSRARMVQQKPGVWVPVVVEELHRGALPLAVQGRGGMRVPEVSSGERGQEAAGRSILRAGRDGLSQASSHMKCLVRRDHPDPTASSPTREPQPQSYFVPSNQH